MITKLLNRNEDKKTAEFYNIAFCIERSYFQHFVVALTSFCENNSTDCFIIWLIHDGIDERQKKILDNIKKIRSLNLKSVCVEGSIFDDLITKKHWPKAAYFRLLLPDILPDSTNMVLYLDADLLIVGNLCELFKIKLENSYLAAKKKHTIFSNPDLNVINSTNYFVSGVMLINLSLWRKGDVRQKAVEFIEKYRDKIKIPDEEAINYVIDGNWKSLDPKYNVTTSFFKNDIHFNNFTPSEREKARANPVIVHFTGSSKPWHFINKHPYKGLYWKYLRMTPYKFYIPEGLNVVNIIKLIVPRSIKYALKKRIRR